jgi:hypothetical protein
MNGGSGGAEAAMCGFAPYSKLTMQGNAHVSDDLLYINNLPHHLNRTQKRVFTHYFM